MSGTLRILVVDDDHTVTRTLVDIFRVSGYEAEAAHSGAEALEKVKGNSFESVQDRSFDCILTDIRMPEMGGVELYRAIKASRPDLPVVLMTAYSSDRLVKEGLKEGAIAVLTKPLDIDVLFDFFSSLRQERSIVVVDDDPWFCQTLGDTLRSFAVTQVDDPQGVVERLQAEGQVVLLDMKLNGGNGLEVFKEIREQYPRLPVVLMTGYQEEMDSAIEVALRMGAYAYLYKPFKMEKLLQLLTEIRHQDLRRVLDL